jgi:hypothetical protein
MPEELTEAPSSGPEVQMKPSASEVSKAPPSDSAVPASGRRAAFRDVRRQLTDEELSSPGVQKLLLDMLQDTDEERETLRSYVGLFHEADKSAAVLSERVRTQTAVEVFFGLGGAIVGLSPFFWGDKPEYGAITGLVGLGLMIGATIGRIVKIIERGIVNQERLWLKVVANTDLKYFIVFNTTYTSTNSISNLQRHAYWFKPKEVKARDYVVLYTRQGMHSEQANKDGTTTHFLFWGLDKTVWNNTGDCAVRFEVNSWQTSKYGE